MFNPNLLYMPGRSILPIARKTINWAGLLSNTQKTLNIVNQAIPIVYQVKPMINNAKTMFKIASELTKSNTNENSNVQNNANESNSTQSNSYSVNNSSSNNDGPSFFIYYFYKSHMMKSTHNIIFWKLQ